MKKPKSEGDIVVSILEVWKASSLSVDTLHYD